MKFVIMSLALVATVCAHPHHREGQVDEFRVLKAEIEEKLMAMTEEDISGYLDKFTGFLEKFKSMTPEEQQAKRAQIQEMIPAPIREKLDGLTDEQKLKIRSKIEKFAAMTKEEQLGLVTTFIAAHKDKMQMRNRFHSRTPEERQQWHAIHFKLDDGAVAYADVAQGAVPIRQLPFPMRPVTADLTDEQKQQLRHEFEAMSSDQDGQMVFMSAVVPQPASVNEEKFQPIRRPADDIMISGNWVHDGPTRRRDPRLPL